PEWRRDGPRPDARLPPQPMTRGRGTASIVASPVLVGAVTTLIVIVSVFLAYNANQGLPFVPTYNLKAELPGGANLVPGDTIALKNATAPVEFDDLLNTFDEKTRQNSQDALTGFGDAFAGRGQDLNVAIQSLAPFFRYLAPVMANLSNPATKLNQFFLQIGRASAQVAPVAAVQAELFADMADTFQAIGSNPAALPPTIGTGPPPDAAASPTFRSR